MRRGACPSLSEPMQTGDGLLARLNPAGGALSPAQLAGVAEAAGKWGNGILEITARGSLQIRGLTRDTAHKFEGAVNAFGIAADPFPEVRVGPLAGCDATEIADPRPLVEAIRKCADPRGLAPKVSVIVDGGGALRLDALLADVRLEALPGGAWAVLVGGNSSTARLLGQGHADAAVAAALALLSALVERGPVARGRDLGEAKLAGIAEKLRPCESPAREPAHLPVGQFELRDGAFARGVALAFGQCSATDLVALAEAAADGAAFRFAPGRGLLTLGLRHEDEDRFLATAERLGLVTRAGDPRLGIVACAGAPACASAHLPTKEIAKLVARAAGLPQVHLSGCAKQCAKPVGATVSLIGGADGFEIVADGRPVPGRLRDVLARAAASCGARERRRHA